ncbi:MAG TPA: GldG family protein, partial [Candidatus Udaeobacter sp.]|nr:GldG family protein [Candidatus Udaeobacter sp.]
MKRRTLLGGANLLASLVLLAALLAGVNWLSSRHHFRKDLTANRAFSLSPQTRKLVTNLDRDIELIAFYRTGDSAVEPVKDLCREVADLSPRVRFEVVDPDRQPGRASRYPSLDYGVTVVDGGERTERIDGANEAALVNAMIQVTRKEKKTIGFLTGHGEHDPTSSEEHGYSALTTRLESEGYAVEKLQLADQTAVPKHIAVVVIAGPEKALFPNEQAAVLAYVAQGGAAMVMSDPEPKASLAALAAPYGIEIGADLVVD